MIEFSFSESECHSLMCEKTNFSRKKNLTFFSWFSINNPQESPRLIPAWPNRPIEWHFPPVMFWKDSVI